MSRDSDVVSVRQKGREVAAAAGFTGSDLTVIATAVSEIARNIVKFATRGEFVFSVLDEDGRKGLKVIARDSGPGIPDVRAGAAGRLQHLPRARAGAAGRPTADGRVRRGERGRHRYHGHHDQVATVRLADDEGGQDVAGEMSSQQEVDETDPDEEDAMLLPELVAHLRANRGELREEWTSRINDAHLLSAMTPHEVFSEVTSVYDNYVAVLETGSVDELRHYARDLSERIIPRGVETHEVIGIVLLLRDVLARSLFQKYRDDFDMLNRVLDAYEPAANRIANTVAGSFVEERERIIRQQQDSLRELSTPVLQVRERLLILPIIGVLDKARAHQLTDQLLRAIRAHRARVVVIDITGVADVDESVADHLVQTVDASRLMGAGVIITGLSSEIAQTLVTIGVDLGKMNTVGDLQGGIEEAEHLLGFKVVRTDDADR